MPGRVSRLTAREVERILAAHDFKLVSQRGSHRKWRNETTRKQVIVPEHAGKTLPLGTLRNIMQNASIPDADWHE
jgi:predicted RNA binding protein YcfA (HicA-like mRNA interferase family)